MMSLGLLLLILVVVLTVVRLALQRSGARKCPPGSSNKKVNEQQKMQNAHLHNEVELINSTNSIMDESLENSVNTTMNTTGPFPWPFIGNLKELQKLSQKLGGQHQALLELCKRYQSSVIKLRLGNKDTIVVSGLDSIQTVLSSEEYDGRPWNYFISLRNMGKKKGITMNDGEDWRIVRNWFVRKMKSVGFARRKLSEYIKEELLEVLQNIKDGGIRKMKPIIVPTTINVLWILVTGKKFKEDRLQYFIDLMSRRAQAFDMTGGTLSAYPWIRHIAPTYSGFTLLVTLNNEFKSILMETIEEHKKNYVPGSEVDLIDMFLTEMYTGKGSQAIFDEDQLIVLLLDILLAGLNVTTNTMEFLFLNMLINQDSQRLLHEEIDRILGPEKLPEISDKPKMPYVQAVIMESQRVTPVVPIIGPRRVLRDTRLQNYNISRNSIVIINLHSIYADPNLYSNPDSFKPERFMRGGERVRDDNLLPFGKGRRQCPGMSLAQSAVFLLFTGVMQHYQLLPVPNQKPPVLQIRPGMTQAPVSLDLLLVPRNSVGVQK